MQNPTHIAAVVLALNAAQASTARLTALKEEEDRLKSAIADYIATGDAVDEQKLMQVAGWRVRLEMLPNVISRTMQERYAAIMALIPVVEALENQLVSLAHEEAGLVRAETEAHLAKVLPPFGKKEDAPKIAGIIIALGGFPMNRDVFGDPNSRPADPSAYPDLAYKHVADRADCALTIGKEREQRGMFIRNDHPAFAALKYPHG